jgi:tetratricopeptide (TPR) repeat protein
MRAVTILLTLLSVAIAGAQSPGEIKQELANLKKLTTAQTEAKAAFTKKPKDEKVKKSYVAATVKLGTATMVSPALPPKEKYRGALRYYREALKVDPKNQEALNNKKMIEAIYKSMGREVPQ